MQAEVIVVEEPDIEEAANHESEAVAAEFEEVKADVAAQVSGEPRFEAAADELAAALRASMSVPGVFSPLAINDRILGDGGLVNNLPVDVARRMGADVIIAVSIGTPLAGRETLGSLLGITTQMVNILTEQNVQASIATLTTQDLLLQPPLGTLSSANFNRAPELVRLGTEYAESVREALNRFAVSPVQYADWVAQRQAVAEQEQRREPGAARGDGRDGGADFPWASGLCPCGG